MPLINCKIELNVLSTAAVGNDDANSDIIFTIKDTNLYVPVVTLPAKDNQKLTKLFHK